MFRIERKGQHQSNIFCIDTPIEEVFRMLKFVQHDYYYATINYNSYSGFHFRFRYYDKETGILTSLMCENDAETKSLVDDFGLFNVVENNLDRDDYLVFVNNVLTINHIQEFNQTSGYYTDDDHDCYKISDDNQDELIQSTLCNHKILFSKTHIKLIERHVSPRFLNYQAETPTVPMREKIFLEDVVAFIKNIYEKAEIITIPIIKINDEGKTIDDITINIQPRDPRSLHFSIKLEYDIRKNLLTHYQSFDLKHVEFSRKILGSVYNKYNNINEILFNKLEDLIEKDMTNIIKK